MLHDLYNEITVMERLQKYQNFCQIYDYGVTPEGYVMVMQRYFSSFRKFRHQLFNSNPVYQKFFYRSEYRRLPIYGHEESMMNYVRPILLTYVKLLEEIKLMH